MPEYKDRQKNIFKYLRHPWTENGLIHKSPYIIALIEARSFTNRNIRSGKKLKKEHGCWLGSLGYMVLLDHIGSMFINETKTINNIDKSLFIKALKYFTELDENSISALYSLRCSFAHNFTLFNSNNNRPSLQRHFTVTSGSMSEFIVFPKQNWDGIHKNKNDYNKTTVNLELLGDLVEGIHLKIIKLTKENKINYYDKLLIKTFIQHK